MINNKISELLSQFIFCVFTRVDTLLCVYNSKDRHPIIHIDDDSRIFTTQVATCNSRMFFFRSAPDLCVILGSPPYNVFD